MSNEPNPTSDAEYGSCVIDVQLTHGPAVYLPPPPLPMGGGESVFLGRTRTENHPQFGRLLALDYDAYQSMAIKRLQELSADAASQFDAQHIVIRHTVGRVPVGAASVFINVVCAHRVQSIEACRFLIDQLKVDVPIWKCEIWETGKTVWKDGEMVEVE